MSLTSHLNNPQSPVTKFFTRRFPNTRSVVKECNDLVRGSTTIRPAKGPGEHFPYSTIGTAIDYRLRYYFKATPHQEFPGWKISPLLYLMDPPVLIPSKAFFDSLETVICQLQPAGRKLDRDAEETLNRYCVVLALLEEPYRAGPHIKSPLYDKDLRTVDDLLDIAQSHWIDDLCAMSEIFYTRFKDTFTQHAILNPILGDVRIDGADGDIILDSCLIDFKAIINPSVSRKMLYQLLGYTLLDFNNRYQIDRVGLYLARQGRLIDWQLDALMQRLSATELPTLEQLRSEFNDVLAALPASRRLTQLAGQS